MSEPKVNEKKVVGRSVAIAIGIICIILAVSLVGAFAYYMPMINDKNKTISSLNTQVSQLDSNVTSLQNQVTSDFTTIQEDNITIMSDKNTIANLTNQLNQLTILQNLVTNESQTLISNESIGLPFNWFWIGNYTAGYISVQVSQSETYVRLTYSSYGISHNNTIVVGTGLTALFPILPSTSIAISIGKTDDSTTNETVTITDYY
jgi:hypothetical protein